MNAAEHRRLERLALRAWPALEDIEDDGWRLRAAQGYTGRANSVAALDPGKRPLDEKIARCEAWYAARNLPAKFRLTLFSQPGNLDEVLAARGYRHVDPVATMTLDLASLAAPAGAATEGSPVELTLDEWFVGKTSATAPIQRAILERIQPTRWLMGWRVDGERVARGLGVLEDGWLGLFNVAVDTARRRRGFGRALMEAMLQRAAGQGARGAYLQVVEENAAAVGLYTGIGFREAYRYWYREKNLGAN